jgi:dTDP-4-amino-4,6-dideoxygalactose transaminase
MSLSVPYVNLAAQHQILKSELLRAVERVFDHGNFILGPEERTFEETFADYCQAQYAIGTASATCALFLALRALGIGSGDEVITAPNSFLASASSIHLAGARPVFVDVRDDFNIDPALIPAAITSRTKAIIPVHLTGRPAEMDAILGIAQKYHLAVIEDCAQAVGAEYKGKRVGSWGDIGCFSFHPLKNLSACGDGGMLTTNQPDLAEKLSKARNHGLINRDECEFWSYNCRLDTLHAAMLSVKMKYLDEWTRRRRQNANFYKQQLAKVVAVPFDKSYEKAVYHTFIIQTEQRDELQAFLKTKGIETKVHYPIPIHLQAAAKNLGYKAGDFPVTERQARCILSLPIYPELTSEQLEWTSSQIQAFYDTNRMGDRDKTSRDQR